MGNLRGLQMVQVVRRALGMAGGGEDGPLVVPKHLEPGGDVGGMVVTNLRSEAEVGAEEGGAQFGDQLLHA